MKRLKIWLLTLGGCALLVGGLLLTLATYATPTLAQDDDEQPAAEVDFVGADECQSCHRDVSRAHSETFHARALIDVGRRKGDIMADFDTGEDVRMVQFPDEDAPRPFDEDDIEYVLGAGRYAQAYVYEGEDENGDDIYRVLPAKWNVVTESWDAFTPAESWDDPAYNFLTQCAGCHTVGLEIERARWVDDGVMCESCHGPAEEHVDLAQDAGRRASEEELVAIRASINPALDPQICGACHSRGTSADGATAFSTTYRAGDTLADSYTVFGPEDTMHWYGTGHAWHQNMQYNEWLISGHPEALLAVQENDYQDGFCLNCHSQDGKYTNELIAEFESGEREGTPPEPLTVDTAKYGVTCISCHDPHGGAEGLDFNLVQEPYALCISCHSQEGIGSTDHIHYPSMEMYEGRPLIENVEAVPGAHFVEGGPDCLTCHMPTLSVQGGMERASHTFKAIMPGDAINVEGLTDSCSECHSEVLTPELLQAFIDDTQAGLRARIETLRGAIDGMAEDQVPEWTVKALDFVEGDGSYGIHNYAYADALLDAVEVELGLTATTAAAEQ